MTHAEKRAIFEANCIYPVITPEFCAGRDAANVAFDALSGGAKVLQLRLKHQSDAQSFAIAKKFRQITADFHALLLIDDRADLALAVGADGVHLGQEDLPVAAVRKIFPDGWIGISTHNANEILSANRCGANYLNIGPLFPTQTKAVPLPYVGWDALTDLLKLSTLPTTVMGGIKKDHLAQLRRCGVTQAAMVTEITAAPNIKAKVEDLIKEMREER